MMGLVNSKSTQMYKIYINEIPVILKASADLTFEDNHIPGVLVAKYSGKVKHLMNFIDLCEKGTKIPFIIIHYPDFEILKADFTNLYVIVEAAGGIVENQKKEFLFIFRRGFWDLPKGKLEKDETKRQTAIREVKEETGLKNVEIIEKIGKTYHTFRTRTGKRAIKKSHWYYMHAQNQKLVPQKSEDIEKAVWLKLETFEQKYKPIYGNITDILSTYKLSKALSPIPTDFQEEE